MIVYDYKIEEIVMVLCLLYIILNVFIMIYDLNNILSKRYDLIINIIVWFKYKIIN